MAESSFQKAARLREEQSELQSRIQNLEASQGLTFGGNRAGEIQRLRQRLFYVNQYLESYKRGAAENKPANQVQRQPGFSIASFSLSPEEEAQYRLNRGQADARTARPGTARVNIGQVPGIDTPPPTNERPRLIQGNQLNTVTNSPLETPIGQRRENAMRVATGQDPVTDMDIERRRANGNLGYTRVLPAQTVGQANAPSGTGSDFTRVSEGLRNQQDRALVRPGSIGQARQIVQGVLRENNVPEGSDLERLLNSAIYIAQKIDGRFIRANDSAFDIEEKATVDPEDVAFILQSAGTQEGLESLQRSVEQFQDARTIAGRRRGPRDTWRFDENHLTNEELRAIQSSFVAARRAGVGIEQFLRVGNSPEATALRLLLERNEDRLPELIKAEAAARAQEDPDWAGIGAVIDELAGPGLRGLNQLAAGHEQDIARAYSRIDDFTGSGTGAIGAIANNGFQAAGLAQDVFQGAGAGDQTRQAGNDFARGAEQFGRATGRGFMQAFQSTVDIPTMFGSKEFAKMAEMMDYMIQSQPELDETFANEFGNGLGSLMFYLIPGGAAGRAMKGVQEMKGIAAIIGRATGAITMAVFEAGGNASGSFREAIANGTPRNQARIRAFQGMAVDAALSSVLNRLGIFGDEAKYWLKALESSATEFLQEGMQEAVGQYIESGEVNIGTKRVLKAAILGGSLGPIGAGIESMSHRGERSDPTREEIAQWEMDHARTINRETGTTTILRGQERARMGDDAVRDPYRIPGIDTPVPPPFLRIAPDLDIPPVAAPVQQQGTRPPGAAEVENFTLPDGSPDPQIEGRPVLTTPALPGTSPRVETGEATATVAGGVVTYTGPAGVEIAPNKNTGGAEDFDPIFHHYKQAFKGADLSGLDAEEITNSIYARAKDLADPDYTQNMSPAQIAMAAAEQARLIDELESRGEDRGDILSDIAKQLDEHQWDTKTGKYAEQFDVETPHGEVEGDGEPLDLSGLAIKDSLGSGTQAAAPEPQAAPQPKPEPEADSNEVKTLGTNKDGHELTEKGGVRSYVRDGIKTTEKVGLRPTRRGMVAYVDVSNRDAEFLTSEELSDREAASQASGEKELAQAQAVLKKQYDEDARPPAPVGEKYEMSSGEDIVTVPQFDGQVTVTVMRDFVRDWGSDVEILVYETTGAQVVKETVSGTENTITIKFDYGFAVTLAENLQWETRSRGDDDSEGVKARVQKATAAVDALIKAGVFERVTSGNTGQSKAPNPKPRPKPPAPPKAKQTKAEKIAAAVAALAEERAKNLAAAEAADEARKKKVKEAHDKRLGAILITKDDFIYVARMAIDAVLRGAETLLTAFGRLVKEERFNDEEIQQARETLEQIIEDEGLAESIAMIEAVLNSSEDEEFDGDESGTNDDEESSNIESTEESDGDTTEYDDDPEGGGDIQAPTPAGGGTSSGGSVGGAPGTSGTSGGSGAGSGANGGIPGGSGNGAGGSGNNSAPGGNPDGGGNDGDGQPGSGGRSDSERGGNYRLPDGDDGAAARLDHLKPPRGVAAKTDRLIAALEAMGEAAKRGYATAEEQDAIALFPGWGFNKDLLDPNTTQGKSANGKKLRELLTVREVAAAVVAGVNSHYTDPQVTTAMWEALQAAGVTPGISILEPSAGSGLFAMTMPAALWEGSNWTMVELEPTTASITRQLFPDERVIAAGFERTGVKEHSFDVVISNVPFAGAGDTGIVDPSLPDQVGPVRAGLITSRLHNYFVVKSVLATKVGGFTAVITSKGTLDAGDTSALETRRWLAENADLVASVRLPNNAFVDQANTEVVTDILIFQRVAPRAFTDHAQYPNWVSTELIELTVPGKYDKSGDPETVDYPINSRYLADPSAVLGTNVAAGTMRRANEYTVEARGDQFTKQKLVDSLVRQLNQNNAKFEPQGDSIQIPNTMRVPDGYTIGEVVMHEGSPHKYSPTGELTPIDLGKASEQSENLKMWTQYLAIKEALNDVYAHQASGEKELAQAQAVLKKQYDKWKKNFGELHSATRKDVKVKDPDTKTWKVDEDGEFVTREQVTYRYKRILAEDVAWPRVFALEKWDTDTLKVKGLADIFTRQVIKYENEPEFLDNVHDALTASVNLRGKVDIEWMSKVTQKTKESLVKELDGEVFLHPDGTYYAKADYLGGEVVTRLREVLAAIEAGDKGLARNKEELERVQPADLEYQEINFSLGSHWVPEDIVRDFAENELGCPDGTTLVDQGFANQWTVTKWHSPDTTVAQYGALDPEGGVLRDPYEILRIALNMSKVEEKTRNENGDLVFNERLTDIVTAAVERMKTSFRAYCDTNGDAQKAITTAYKEKVNLWIPTMYDGSKLTFPLLDTGSVQLRTPRVNGVMRTLANAFSLLWHGVGSGKTYTAAMSMMKRKQTGLSNKPMFLAYKPTLEQIVGDFQRAYPTARILAPDEDSFKRGNREEFLAQAAMGDWDMIVISHEQFDAMVPSESSIIAYYTQVIEDLLAYYDIRDVGHAAEIENARHGDQKLKKAAKEIIKINEQVNKAIDEARENVGGITFDRMGVDYLVVDEAHFFKGLNVKTKTSDIVSTSVSKRAQLMELKTALIRSVGGAVTFMTGTALVNSPSEVHTWLRYLAPQHLARHGWTNFDDFLRSFCDVQTQTEVTVAGAIKQKARVRRWINIPELANMFSAYADVVRTEDIEEITLPKLIDEDGNVSQKPIIRAVPATESQRTYMKQLYEQFRNLKAIKNQKQRNAERFRLMMRAVKASQDMRLLDPRFDARQAGLKAISLAEDLSREYHEGTDNKSAHVAFITLGVPGGGVPFNMYEEVKRLLVARGVKEDDIVFIHDAKTTEDRVNIAGDIRSGKKRILIGTRKKLGVGMNIQDRLKSAHHMDLGWNAAELEQGNGRIVRHGNQYTAAGVRIYYYVTQGTGDQVQAARTMLKHNAFIDFQKALAGIAQKVNRFAEDFNEEEGALAIGEMAATASSDPRLLEMVGLEAEEDKTSKEAEIIERAKNVARVALQEAETEIAKNNEAIRLNTAKREKIEAIVAEAFDKDGFLQIEVTQEYADRFSAQEARRESNEAKRLPPTPRNVLLSFAEHPEYAPGRYEAPALLIIKKVTEQVEEQATKEVEEEVTHYDGTKEMVKKKVPVMEEVEEEITRADGTKETVKKEVPKMVKRSVTKSVPVASIAKTTNRGFSEVTIVPAVVTSDGRATYDGYAGITLTSPADTGPQVWTAVRKPLDYIDNNIRQSEFFRSQWERERDAALTKVNQPNPAAERLGAITQKKKFLEFESGASAWAIQQGQLDLANYVPGQATELKNPVQIEYGDGEIAVLTHISSRGTAAGFNAENKWVEFEDTQHTSGNTGWKEEGTWFIVPGLLGIIQQPNPDVMFPEPISVSTESPELIRLNALHDETLKKAKAGNTIQQVKAPSPRRRIRGAAAADAAANGADDSSRTRLENDPNVAPMTAGGNRTGIPGVVLDALEGAPVKKLDQIVLDLVATFPKFMRGSSPRGTLGAYYRKENIVRVRGRLNLKVITHELGHLLIRNFKLFEGLPDASLDILDQQLSAPEFGDTVQPGMTKAARREERFSEWLLQFLAYPRIGATSAPFAATLLRAKIPQVGMNALIAYGADVRAIYEADPSSLVNAGFKDSGTSDTWVKRIQNWFAKRGILEDHATSNADIARAMVTDHMAPLSGAFHETFRRMGLKPEDQPEGLLPVNNPENWLRDLPYIDQMVDAMVQGNLNDLHGNETDASFQKVFDPLLEWQEAQIKDADAKPNRKEKSALLDSIYNDLRAYMTAQRSLDYGTRSRAKVEDAIAEFHTAIAKEYDHKLRQVANALWRVVKPMQQSGQKNAAVRRVKRLIQRKSDIFDRVMARRVTAFAARRRGEVERHLQNLGWTEGAGLRDQEDLAKGVIEQIKAKDAADGRLAPIEAAAAAYREIGDWSLDMLRDAGWFTQEDVDTIREENPYWISMKRDMEDSPSTSSHGRGAVARARQIVFSVEGASRMKNDPIGNLAETVMNTMYEAHRNRMAATWVDLVEGLDENGGDLAFKIEDGEEPTHADRVLTVYRNGVKERWEIKDKWVAITIMQTHNTFGLGVLGRIASMMGRVLGVQARTLRFGVTTALPFILFNFVRDSVTRVTMSEHGRNPVDSAYKSKRKGDRMSSRDYRMLGMGFARSEVMPGYGDWTNAQNRLIKHMKRDRRHNLVMSKGVSPEKIARLLWGATGGLYGKMMEGTESSNRIAAFNDAFKYAKAKLNYDHENATRYAKYYARRLMADFRRGGYIVKILSPVIPFLNGAVAGTSSFWHHATKNKGRAALRLVIFAVMGLALELTYAGLTDSEQWRQQLPEYQRNAFFNFYVGEGRWVRIPKGHETALFALPMERSLTAARGERDAFDGGLTAIMAALSPVELMDLLGPVRLYTEYQTNYDFFTREHIVPEYEQKLWLENRKQLGSTEIGKFVGNPIGVDGRMVDHAAQSLFGHLGRLVTDTSDALSGRRDPWAVAMRSVGLISLPSPNSSPSVIRVEAVCEGNGIQSPLKEMRTAYFKEKDPAAREILGRLMIQKAEALEVVMEEVLAAGVQGESRKRALKRVIERVMQQPAEPEN